MADLNTRIATAEGKAASEHRLYERAERGRKAAQARVEELEKTIRDARKWIIDNPEEAPGELKRILGRPGVVRNSYELAGRSKADA